MGKDLYSIIVPVYNVEACLDACISSILAQTYQNFELILVDDGSTDQSGKICDCYAGQDHRIKVIHQKNGGVACARNRGIETSVGEWICFVDSDDSIKSDWLEHYVEYSDADMTMQNISVITSSGKSYCTFMEDLLAIGDERLDIRSEKSKLNSPCKCFRASIIREHHIRFEVGMHLGEDLVFVLEYMNHSDSMRLLSYDGYVQNSQNSTLTKRFYAPELRIEWSKYITNTVDNVCKHNRNKLLYRSIVEHQFSGLSQYVTLNFDRIPLQKRFEIYDILRSLYSYVHFKNLKWTRWGFAILKWFPNKSFDSIVAVLSLPIRNKRNKYYKC